MQPTFSKPPQKQATTGTGLKTAVMPPTAPPTLPPAHEPLMQPTHSKLPQKQPLSTPPAKPPGNLSESAVKEAPLARQLWPMPSEVPCSGLSMKAQMLLQEWQQQQEKQGFPTKKAPPPTTLNFPLEAWAQWLYPSPPQYAAPRATAR